MSRINVMQPWLGPEESATVTVVVKTTATGERKNTATARSDGEDPT